MAYLDKIIIFSASEEEHKHIQKCFIAYGNTTHFKLKWSKCKFMQNETQYLAFIISKYGIMVDHDKLKVMRQILTSTCVRAVRSFIGMCSYYKRCIQSFSANAKSLIRLTKKVAKFELN